MAEKRRGGNPAWVKGVSGNPSGTSREVMIRTHNNARKATALREKFLEALESRIATVTLQAHRDAPDLHVDAESLAARRVLDLLTPEVNRLLADSEARGYGAPKTILDVRLPAEKPLNEYSEAELEAIVNGEDDIVDAEFVEVPPEEGTYLLVEEGPNADES